MTNQTKRAIKKKKNLKISVSTEFEIYTCLMLLKVQIRPPENDYWSLETRRGMSLTLYVTSIYRVFTKEWCGFKS